MRTAGTMHRLYPVWKKQYIPDVIRVAMMLERRYRGNNGRVSSKIVPPMIEPSASGEKDWTALWMTPQMKA
jgi:hypothetical protein